MLRYTPRDHSWANPQLVESLCKTALKERPTEIRSLEGGFNNANFALDNKLVLRLYSQGQDVALRESKVLEMATWQGIPAPKILSSGCFEERGFLLLDLVEGRPMDGEADFADVGAQLAKIHSLSFPHHGLFGADGELQEIPSTFGQELVADALNGRAGSRLGAERIFALHALEVPQSHPSGPTLVHSDFNPKNILVNDKGKVTAILDWEFAMAGDPLVDLGNFLRFQEDYEPEQIARFEKGYLEAGGLLPDDWQRQAQLHDLVSLVSFLDNPEEYPETFATALDRIDTLLANDTVKPTQTPCLLGSRSRK